MAEKQRIEPVAAQWKTLMKELPAILQSDPDLLVVEHDEEFGYRLEVRDSDYETRLFIDLDGSVWRKEGKEEAISEEANTEKLPDAF